jgi:protocatechuate 4,5-dioxygenase, alpha chain
MYLDTSIFDDIPGTRVFTHQRARKGYALNQFCMTLMKPENRERFRADERAYLDDWPLTQAQRDGVLARNFNSLLDEGGNIYFLARLLYVDGVAVQDGVSTMTDLTVEQYRAMMLAGGRSPEGWRSIKEGC